MLDILTVFRTVTSLLTRSDINCRNSINGSYKLPVRFNTVIEPAEIRAAALR